MILNPSNFHFISGFLAADWLSKCMTDKPTPCSRLLEQITVPSSPGKEVSRILLNRKVHYRAHNSPPYAPTPVHILPSHLPKIDRLPSMPESSKWSPSFKFSNNTLHAFLSYPMEVTCSVHLNLLHFVSSTNNKVSSYQTFPTFLFLLPTSAQIISYTPQVHPEVSVLGKRTAGLQIIEPVLARCNLQSLFVCVKPEMFSLRTLNVLILTRPQNKSCCQNPCPRNERVLYRGTTADGSDATLEISRSQFPVRMRQKTVCLLRDFSNCGTPINLRGLNKNSKYKNG